MDEALRRQDGVRASTLTKDYRTILIIATTGLSTEARERLGETLKTYRRRNDLVGEFPVGEADGGEVPWGKGEMPSGWPLVE